MSGQYALRLWGRDITPAYDKASWYWALFIASYFFLLGFPRLFTLPAAVLLLLGIYQSIVLLRRHGFRGLPRSYHLFLLLFLALWLPLLFSLTDAKYLPDAASDTVKILVYGFVGVATVWLAREKRVLPPLVFVLTMLALFWTADVIFQRLAGFDVFGVVYSLEGEARAGAYFKNPAKFGTYLACMDVLALFYLLPRLRRPVPMLALWLFLLLGMVFSMSRTGWAIFMLFSLPLLMRETLRTMRHAWVWALGLLLLSVPAFFYYYQHDPVLQQRMARSLAIMDGMTYENWNTVLTYRLDLWRAALQMFCEHWLNGQGLHAFTEDFHLYAAAPFWQGVQPSHEHQYLLQVMTATGVLGLAGLLVLHGLLFRSWRRPGMEAAALPVAMYLLAMWFPLGSHFSFYSSEWVWANLLLLGLLAGALTNNPAELSSVQAQNESRKSS